jgi:hypothetical protein
MNIFLFHRKNVNRKLSFGAASKIRGEAADLPVTVPRWIGAVAAANFPRLVGGLALAFGAARRRLGERALGRLRRRWLSTRSVRGRVACGMQRRLVMIGWHYV